MLKQKSSVPPRSINREQAPDLYSLRRPVEPDAISHYFTIHQIKTNPERDFFLFGEPGGTSGFASQNLLSLRRFGKRKFFSFSLISLRDEPYGFSPSPGYYEIK